VAYLVRCRSLHETGWARDTHAHCRLFHRRPDVRWERRVHEQITGPLALAGVPIRLSDVTIHHLGYADPATTARKKERNLALLLAELADRPDDVTTLMRLGSNAYSRQDWAWALDYLQRAFPGLDLWYDDAPELCLMLGRAYIEADDLPGARAAYALGLATQPGPYHEHHFAMAKNFAVVCALIDRDALVAAVERRLDVSGPELRADARDTIDAAIHDAIVEVNPRWARPVPDARPGD
jgi:hypothetical protein